MSIQLPAAPASFYMPSLMAVKEALEKQNGTSKGRIVLIEAAPHDIDNAWSQVGVAANTDLIYNRGTHVLGYANLNGISCPMAGPEEDGGEKGFKLQFEPILDIPIYIDGSGSKVKVLAGAALVVGVDNYDLGQPSDVIYFPGVVSQGVTDGSTFSVPGFEIIINYSTPYV